MGDKRKPQAWPRGTAPCHGARRRGGGPASRVAPADAACPVRGCGKGRLGPLSAPGCRPGTKTRYRREKTVRGLPGAPTHNRPCSRPVYGTPKMSPGRAAASGFCWGGSEDSHARIASGDCQVQPTWVIGCTRLMLPVEGKCPDTVGELQSTIFQQLIQNTLS